MAPSLRLSLCLLPFLAGIAAAAEPEYTLVLEGHRYSPDELVVPAGVRVRLTLENKDQTPEEFESYALNREKLVAPASKVVVYVGPLAPGRYEYFGDFNPTTARGWLVARP